MIETLNLLPFPFWLVALALIYFSIQAWNLRKAAIGIPMLMVLFTTTVWYVGDAFYNDYSELIRVIGPSDLVNAWWETLLFVCTFGIGAPVIHRSFNRKYLGKGSNILYLFRHGVTNAESFQTQTDALCRLLAIIWAGIMFIALVRTDFDFAGLFMPYLGSHASPWSRGRIGAGFDSLIALAGYVLIGLTAAFGVISSLSSHRSTRILAIAIYLLAIPSFIFDRTRNTMLATLLPAFIAWVFLRVRANLFIRILILAAGFLVLESWLKFVIENRSDGSIVRAFQRSMTSTDKESKDSKHEGLNMFEELGHVNSFLTDGSYHPNWGARYFAELTNPVPRVLWPGKPVIGIDYALARGMGYGDVDASEGGIAASISTGMIGQGVVNFGRLLGPIAAALIMAYWAALLARQDLLGGEAGRIYLYALGLFLTFNMGRDITFLVIYPFVFGYLLLLAVKARNKSLRDNARSKSISGKKDPTGSLRSTTPARY